MYDSTFISQRVWFEFERHEGFVGYVEGRPDAPSDGAFESESRIIVGMADDDDGLVTQRFRCLKTPNDHDASDSASLKIRHDGHRAERERVVLYFSGSNSDWVEQDVPYYDAFDFCDER